MPLVPAAWRPRGVLKPAGELSILQRSGEFVGTLPVEWFGVSGHLRHCAFLAPNSCLVHDVGGPSVAARPSWASPGLGPPPWFSPGHLLPSTFMHFGNSSLLTPQQVKFLFATPHYFFFPSLSTSASSFFVYSHSFLVPTSPPSFTPFPLII